MQQNAMAANSSDMHLETAVITVAILDFIKSAKMQPGDAININVTEYELGLRGISDKDFKRGFAQLINQGAIGYIGSRLCLTGDGFRGLKQGREAIEHRHA